ncbi:MAG: hypothetical protein U1F57_02070 [bacterium]
MVGHFVEQASDWKSLAAMMAGGIAYRLGKVATFYSPLKNLSLVPLRDFIACTVGLAAEVTAFEGVNEILTSPNPLLTKERAVEKSQRWLTSFVHFAALKSFGRLAEGQNIFVQHGLQDLAMVLGHRLTYSAGLSQAPEGGLAEQFLHAETTNLQLGAGASLAHGVTGGRLFALERKLDLEIRSRSVPTPISRANQVEKIRERNEAGLRFLQSPFSLPFWMMVGIGSIGGGGTWRSRKVKRASDNPTDAFKNATAAAQEAGKILKNVIEKQGGKTEAKPAQVSAASKPFFPTVDSIRTLVEEIRKILVEARTAERPSEWRVHYKTPGRLGFLPELMEKMLKGNFPAQHRLIVSSDTVEITYWSEEGNLQSETQERPPIQEDTPPAPPVKAPEPAPEGKGKTGAIAPGHQDSPSTPPQGPLFNKGKTQNEFSASHKQGVFAAFQEILERQSAITLPATFTIEAHTQFFYDLEKNIGTFADLLRKVPLNGPHKIIIEFKDRMGGNVIFQRRGDKIFVEQTRCDEKETYYLLPRATVPYLFEAYPASRLKLHAFEPLSGYKESLVSQTRRIAAAAGARFDETGLRSTANGATFGKLLAISFQRILLMKGGEKTGDLSREGWEIVAQIHRQLEKSYVFCDFDVIQGFFEQTTLQDTFQSYRKSIERMNAVVDKTEPLFTTVGDMTLDLHGRDFLPKGDAERHVFLNFLFKNGQTRAPQENIALLQDPVRFAEVFAAGFEEYLQMATASIAALHKLRPTLSLQDLLDPARKEAPPSLQTTLGILEGISSFGRGLTLKKKDFSIPFLQALLNPGRSFLGIYEEFIHEVFLHFPFALKQRIKLPTLLEIETAMKQPK